MQRFVSHSVQDTQKIAAKLAEKLTGGEVIAFTGPMGMGKTAFTRGLVLALGGGDVVSSPTFALVNEYDARLTVQHFDMYGVAGWTISTPRAFSITSIRTTCSSLSGAKTLTALCRKTRFMSTWKRARRRRSASLPLRA